MKKQKKHYMGEENVTVLRRSATGYITPKDMLAVAAEGDPRLSLAELSPTVWRRPLSDF